MQTAPAVLIPLCGLPAVGKSTLAMALARRIGAVDLRIDTIEQAMRNAGLTVSGPEVYLAAGDLAEDNLRIGHTVLVDSVNPVAVTRNYWHEIAPRMKVALVEIEVVCSDKREHCRRVESRITDIPGLLAEVGFEARSVPFVHPEVEPGPHEMFVGRRRR